MLRTMVAAITVCMAGSGLVMAGESKATDDGKKPLRLVCIGDSITQGRKGGGKHKPTFSYRYPLWKMLVDAGAEVDFVGSLKVGFNGDPDWKKYKGKEFDRDHEGHWGWTTRGIREKLPGWIKNYTPDMALILLGTNDRGKKAGMTLDDSKDEMKKIIQILRKKNPKVIVIIGQCFQEWKPFPELRKKMNELAKELASKESSVITVDHSLGWVSKPDLKGTHTVDWVHPNVKGDEKLAGNYFKAMKPYLEKAGCVEKKKEQPVKAEKQVTK